MNKALLEEKIKASGLKYGYLARSLGLSPQGLIKKRNGSIPFTIREVNLMKDLLGLTNSERDKIFLE